MEKHILFIVENSPAPCDPRVWKEALAAKEFGYKVSIISPVFNNSDKKYLKKQGIDIYRHRYIQAKRKSEFFLEYGNALFWELILSLRIFLKKPFHYIHAANPPDNIFIIGLLYKIVGVKYIFDHHDIVPENYLVKFGKKDLFYRLCCLFEKLSFKMADIVISTNDSYKEIALQRGGKKEAEVFVVRNGPELSEIPRDGSRQYRKNKKFKIGYIGAIGDQERIDVLLEAARHIVFEKRFKNIEFVVIGDGPHLQPMVELSKNMKLEDYVRFTGFIPNPHFYKTLADADLGVNPEFSNAYTDKSTMIKIMEYMTLGLPVVQFVSKEGKNSAGNSSVYVENDSAIELAERIIELLEDPERRRKMGNIGKKRVETYLNWEIQKKNLRDAYAYVSKV